MTIASDSFDDQGDRTAVPDDLDGTDEIFDELDACLVECESVRANCEKDDGAEALFPAAAADEGSDVYIDGDEGRSLRVERRYSDRSSLDLT